MADGSVPLDPQRAALYLRVLSGDAGAMHVWFDRRVLDPYLGQPSFKVIRTTSAGRVSRAGGWLLDFGIAGEQEELIHATVLDLQQRLPESERRHWAQHVVTPPVSRNFVTMRMVPGTCVDDGDVRPWAPLESPAGQ